MVSYLRAVEHHAKIYIRSMQNGTKEPVVNLFGPCSRIKDFFLLCVQVYSESPKEECLTYGEVMSATSLNEHIIVCKKG